VSDAQSPSGMIDASAGERSSISSLRSSNRRPVESA
jgi:hypothetical protein